MSPRCSLPAGYRVIVPYLRGYGTTRFLSGATLPDGQQSVLGVDVIALMDALRHGGRGHRRIQLGRTDRQRRGRPLARPVQGHGVGQRLPDRLGGGRRGACPPPGFVVVIVLFRHRTRPGGLWHRVSAGASSRGSSGTLPRPSGTSTMRRSTEPNAASFDTADHVGIVIHDYRWRLRPGRGRGTIRRSRKAAGREPGWCFPCRRSPSKVMPTAHPIREPTGAYAAKFAGKYTHRTI